MYKILNDLLSDKKTDTIFECFGLWHIIYMVVIFSGIILTVMLLKNKTQKTKDKTIKIIINIAFGFYILDFFLMPFAYGGIDLEKLPFHICTITCVLCFISNNSRFLSKFKVPLAVLGLVGNIIYVIYPAGVGWYQIHPLSYRVVQTLMYHGIMSLYGILVVTFDKERLNIKKCYKELIFIVILVLWALLGNYLYNYSGTSYNHMFNWFFVIQDPFYKLPPDIAKIVMPFIMVVVIFTAVMIVYGVYYLIKLIYKNKGNNI